MSDIAIRVEELSKQYRIGGKQERYRTLRDTLTDAFASPFRRAGKLLRGQATGAAELNETIWALKDVSLEVKRGEVVGIIGRNGAGKTTLLKILSRITEPTEGYAEIHGRVGSLLEVGTGFHPELTGRENIYLNGAILGMKKVEIERKFDEIVAFAEIEKFMDTPVKHYSSGMYVRLAFAVAAHLEPEILLVDEVLAVGDLEFQKKCLGKMQDVAGEGRTVVFVSHNMPAVTRLCPKTVLLDQGQIMAMGNTAEVIGQYVFSGHGTTAERRWDDLSTAPGDHCIRLTAVRARDKHGRIPESFDIREPIGIDIEYTVLEPGLWFTPALNVVNQDGVMLFLSVEQTDPNWISDLREPGKYRSTCWIPGNVLAEGMHFVSMTFWGFTRPPTKKATEDNVIVFNVHDPLEGNSVRGKSTLPYPGVVRPKLGWTTVCLDLQDSRN